MQDLLGFDKMVTPIIIRILYFLGLLAVLAMTATALFQGRILVAIGVLVFGAIIVRVYSELLILLFRIHDNLVSINQQMKARNTSGPL
ncbi:MULTISPECIES: DUF4282 domain-containing protein [Variovorax]|jgi:hypothetical protein|uniref:DUF4282 domain-containing protein n=1 Tax=Variovorax paradoxus TaxID=34073 RepID=A0AA91DTZ9_VARPD|nr:MULTISPECIES: DUF4282 domain-containing protein [Variovorax]AVQ80141.1 DUF4282 domain-containing protein [Variovorax sp. PMC12]OAK66385.1 hypothetical protein A3K87_07995 [Variovorax paradoxus]QRY30457.1 DUF4282 domain-containing protein [Variovorax sp. PDNC026]